MSKTHSFGRCGSGIGHTIFERVMTPLRWASVTATVTVILFASAALAADVKIPSLARLTKCVLPDPDAPPKCRRSLPIAAEMAPTVLANIAVGRARIILEWRSG
jgi:hypothetical protein